MAIRFHKMHGAGNDFVVIDLRDGGEAPGAAAVAAMADRRRGVGFDQMALIHPAQAGLSLTFLNADGSASAACGNATRCIAAWDMARTGAEALDIRTDRGALRAVRQDAEVWVDMGLPLTGWRDIPLARDCDTDALPLPGAPVATSMGNPHCTYFEDDGTLDVETLGPATEAHALFPQRTNVQAAQVTGGTSIRARVWERGVGVTLASGSSACAVLAAAHRRGLTGPRAEVEMDGGTLRVDWQPDAMWMTGPTAHVFEGVWL
ncbi:MAG: diaminopimelate epimerase [Paracoccaceae bacterium]